jgi:membrane-bound lytic murein transglycosylase
MSAVRPSTSGRRRWKLLAPFFEQKFQPLRIGRLREPERLLTGYFEPIVAGSRFPTPQFHVPLYRRPRDLVAADGAKERRVITLRLSGSFAVSNAHAEFRRM